MIFLASLLLSHASSILDLIRRCLADEERTDVLMRLSYGLIGDLADCFPQGQLKQLLLANWIGAELRARHRMPEETKKTMRWAREVNGCGSLTKDFANFPTLRW
jgi:importin subunit beta-1